MISRLKYQPMHLCEGKKPSSLRAYPLLLLPPSYILLTWKKGSAGIGGVDRGLFVEEEDAGIIIFASLTTPFSLLRVFSQSGKKKRERERKGGE